VGHKNPPEARRRPIESRVEWPGVRQRADIKENEARVGYRLKPQRAASNAKPQAGISNTRTSPCSSVPALAEETSMLAALNGKSAIHVSQ
jgi:hypothetical protein